MSRTTEKWQKEEGEVLLLAEGLEEGRPPRWGGGPSGLEFAGRSVGRGGCASLWRGTQVPRLPCPLSSGGAQLGTLG